MFFKFIILRNTETFDIKECDLYSPHEGKNWYFLISNKEK